MNTEADVIRGRSIIPSSQMHTQRLDLISFVLKLKFRSPPSSATEIRNVPGESSGLANPLRHMTCLPSFVDHNPNIPKNVSDLQNSTTSNVPQIPTSANVNLRNGRSPP
jgi:hypothetical protein